MRLGLKYTSFAFTTLLLTLSFVAFSSLTLSSAQAQEVISQTRKEANRLFQLGSQQYQKNQFQQAAATLEKALQLFKQLQDLGSQGDALFKLGQTYEILGQYDLALNRYQQAAQIFAKLREQDNQAGAWSGVGIAYLRTGKYSQAIDAFQQALAIIPDAVIPLNGLGLAYTYLGQYDKALKFHQQVLAIRRKIGKRTGEAITLLNIGVIYEGQNQYGDALSFYQQALDIYRQVRNPTGQVRSLNLIGEIYNLQAQPSKAMNYFQDALKIASQEINDPRGQGVSLSNIGRTHFNLQQYGEALEAYEQALSIRQKIGDREGEGKTLSDIGELLAKQSKTEVAIVFLKQAVNIYESIREGLQKLPQEQQESYTQTVSSTYRTLADLLLSQGRVLEAQQVLELLKIQELRDYTHDTRTGDSTTGSLLNPLEVPIPEAYNDKIALGRQLTQCEHTNCSQRSQLIAQREAANDKFTALVERLKKALRDQEIKDPAQLQSDRIRLAAQKVVLANPKIKTVLVYPLVLDDKLWLVWGSQAGKSAVVFDSKEMPVSRKDLSAKVGELQTLLSQHGDLQKLKQVSQELYRWLINPIRKQLDDNGIQQIVFSLDRATRYIPMAVLYDGKQFLVENFAVSIILTAEIDTKDTLSANPQDDPVLGLGVTQAVAGFPALPAVKAELDGIIRTSDHPQDSNGIYPGLELLDQNFTETALREKVSDYRILHIATHGKFVPGNPEDSFLVLGDGKKLSIPSIKSITALANTHLVVLSACETGKGGIDAEGLEVAGISHYFLLSGAKSVMASLWLVNDPATSLLMREFYSRLSKGNISKAEALRQVQIEFLKGNLKAENTSDRAGGRRYSTERSSIDSFAHPYYWAPFILIGNGL